MDYRPPENMLGFHRFGRAQMVSICENVLKTKDSRAFEVDCTASPVGAFRAGADSLSVTIGQRIRRFGGEEMWDSVTIQCRDEGSELVIRVLVCHPGWDEPLQVVCIRSAWEIGANSDDPEALWVSLEHSEDDAPHTDEPGSGSY